MRRYKVTLRTESGESIREEVVDAESELDAGYYAWLHWVAETQDVILPDRTEVEPT